MDLGRHGSIRDVLIDWAGIAIGAIILAKVYPTRICQV